MRTPGARATSTCSGTPARRCASTSTARPCPCCRSRAAKARGWSATTAAATLDAISSWWTNLFGHAEPRIAQAIARQAHTLEHVILAGVSHAPAVELAEKLLAIAPRQAGREPLAKVFYADNGSAGVEVALKMAFHWFRNRGIEGRTKFIALDNGYHGETLGALAVGDIPLYRRVYAPLLARGDVRALARCLPVRAGRNPGRPRARAPPTACATCWNATPERSAR